MRILASSSTLLVSSQPSRSRPGCSPEPVSAIAAHNAGHGTAEIYDASFDEALARPLISRSNGTQGRHPGGSPRAAIRTITNHPTSEAPSFLDQVGVWFEPIGTEEDARERGGDDRSGDDGGE